IDRNEIAASAPKLGKFVRVTDSPSAATRSRSAQSSQKRFPPGVSGCTRIAGPARSARLTAGAVVTGAGGGFGWTAAAGATGSAGGPADAGADDCEDGTRGGAFDSSAASASNFFIR